MYNTTKPSTARIIELAENTYGSKYIKVKRCEVYATFKRRFPYSILWPLLGVHELDHTDGGGTKGIYHWQQRTFYNAVLDVLAMNLNDMLLERARPYKLQNHIILPEDDGKAVVQIMEAMSDECSKRKIVITGGETSIQNNIKGLDISMTVSGFIRHPKPNQFQAGDLLIGFKSNGLHSNGFTKVREVFGDEFRPEFVEPTRVYLEDILRLEKKYGIHGMMHITGGGFTKIKPLLPGLDAHIYNNHMLSPQPIFHELYKRGVSDEEMYKTFNCGIGFVIGVPEKHAEDALDAIETAHGEADIIGEVTPGTGKVKINSEFSDRTVKY
jgi:phosphoribosylformylglycinamidine cyclo-ligase